MTQDTELWWQGPALARLLSDLLGAELARMRPGWSAGPIPWSDDLALGPEGLDLDSLERVRLATALSEVLDLVEPDRFPDARSFGGLVREARRLLPSAGGRIAFRTSGSTGRPKTVRHPFDALLEEVDHHSRRLGPARRVLSAVPSHPIYGFLFTVLLPWRLGAEVVDLRAHGLGAWPGLARAGDLLVATPTLWAAATEGRGWPEGVRGVTSGAPCPPEVADRLRAAGLRLLEIYGSTETGGIGARDDPHAPFRLFPWWRREGDDRLVRTVEGRIGPVDLPDHVAWEGADLLRPAGRRDGAVQVFGANVHPGRVRSVLLAHPEVAEARVRLMGTEEGDWLKAFVVPRPGVVDHARLRRELDAWARARLSPPERPRAIAFGPAVPLSPAGKPADWPAGWPADWPADRPVDWPAEGS